MRLIANKELEDELADLHRGLHFAMDELIRNKDYQRAEEIMRQMDGRMAHALNVIQLVEA